MFRSLYTRYKDELQPTGTTPANTLDMPATYLEGLVNVDPTQWKLDVSGMVVKPRTLTMADLEALPKVTQNRRIVSIEGWSYRAEWAGIPLHHLVEEVKPQAAATLIRQVNLMGQEEFLPLSVALQNRALLCFGINGKKLLPLYGGPLRLLVFDRYSYKGMTQLAKLEFVSADAETPGFWQQHGYPSDGLIEPGRYYYAFDLKKLRPVPQAGEVTIY